MLLPRGRKELKNEAETFGAPRAVEASNARDQHPLDPPSRDHPLSVCSPGRLENLSLSSTAGRLRAPSPLWMQGWGREVGSAPTGFTLWGQGCCGLCTAEGPAAPGWSKEG